mmetsp:Transcript_58555/g.188163  ORF Transcript_58555/g.188163 Transcript_58555/m.188163 type:complete len:268 (+) Transcript_58555:213-1016(+)
MRALRGARCRLPKRAARRQKLGTRRQGLEAAGDEAHRRFLEGPEPGTRVARRQGGAGRQGRGHLRSARAPPGLCPRRCWGRGCRGRAPQRGPRPRGVRGANGSETPAWVKLKVRTALAAAAGSRRGGRAGKCGRGPDGLGRILEERILESECGAQGCLAAATVRSDVRGRQHPGVQAFRVEGAGDFWTGRRGHHQHTLEPPMGVAGWRHPALGSRGAQVLDEGAPALPPRWPAATTRCFGGSAGGLAQRLADHPWCVRTPRALSWPR